MYRFDDPGHLDATLAYTSDFQVSTQSSILSSLPTISPLDSLPNTLIKQDGSNNASEGDQMSPQRDFDPHETLPVDGSETRRSGNGPCGTKQRKLNSDQQTQ